MIKYFSPQNFRPLTAVSRGLEDGFGPFLYSVRITTENELKTKWGVSETYVKQLGEIFQDQFSYLWYCKFKDTCPMLKVCTYRHFRSISTLFSYIIFQTAGVSFLVLPRFLELRWSMKLLDNGLRIIICRLGVVDLVEKSIFPTVGHNGDLKC